MNIRLTQATRMLALNAAATEDTVRAAIAARPADFARALFQEAADSDDVISIVSALDYLDTRLVFFASVLDTEAEHRIRQAFAELVRAWE